MNAISRTFISFRGIVISIWRMATIETTGNLSSLFASASGKSDILVASLYCNSFAYTVSLNILSFPAATQLVLTALAMVHPQSQGLNRLR